MDAQASSSRVPPLTSLDTSAGERLVEQQRAEEREQWRAACDKERERAIRAKERARQREREEELAMERDRQTERDEELTHYYIGTTRVNPDGTSYVSFYNLNPICYHNHFVTGHFLWVYGPDQMWGSGR